MKKIITYMLALASLAVFQACSEDDLNPTSVIKDSVNENNAFDDWLDENYRAAYNIQFKYKYEDIESDLLKDLVPAELSQSVILAKMVKFLWLEPYSEVAGETFLRSYSPRVFHVIGTVGWNSNNTYTLGTAEGGLKITLYAGNWLSNWFQVKEDPSSPTGYRVMVDKDNINFYYLHTIHHEFGHILHQTKNYPNDFKRVTSGQYTTNWESVSDADAYKMGFISPYASNNTDDDFVETLSFYLTLSDAEWQARLDEAGEDGSGKIMQKLQYVKDYMQDSWNIDLDLLKEVLARRYSEIEYLDWVNL